MALRLKISNPFVTVFDREVRDKSEAVGRLVKESAPTGDYFFLLMISTLLATLGLALGNVSIILGGMLLAPLLVPILSLGLGIVTFNGRALLRSGWTILKSLMLVVLLSYIGVLLYDVKEPLNTEILQRVRPDRFFLDVAILSGIGATYAWIKPKLSASLPGIALSVSLIPPLCTVGIGIALHSLVMVMGALQLFLMNLAGVIFASVGVFILFGFRTLGRIEEKEIHKEENIKAS